MGEPVSFRRFLELLWAGLYRLPPVSFMIPLKLLKLHAYSCSIFLGIGFESFLRMHRLLCYREDDTCARGFQILSQGKDCKLQEYACNFNNLRGIMKNAHNNSWNRKRETGSPIDLRVNLEDIAEEGSWICSSPAKDTQGKPFWSA